jgi:hypothetical protein
MRQPPWVLHNVENHGLHALFLIKRYLDLNVQRERDLKTVNLLVADDGTICICNFGISNLLKPLEDASTQVGTVSGLRFFSALRHSCLIALSFDLVFTPSIFVSMSAGQGALACCSVTYFKGPLPCLPHAMCGRGYQQFLRINHCVACLKGSSLTTAWSAKVVSQTSF